MPQLKQRPRNDLKKNGILWQGLLWCFFSCCYCLFVLLVKLHLTSEGPRVWKLKRCLDFPSKPCVFFFPGDERSRESPAPAEAQMQAGAEGGGRVSRCCWKCSVTQLKKIFWGVAVVLGVCSSWSGSTQLAKLTFKKFDAPFTLTWFATNWNFLFFPLYYLGHVFKSAEKQSPKQRYRYGSFCFCSPVALAWRSAPKQTFYSLDRACVCLPLQVCWRVFWINSVMR